MPRELLSRDRPRVFVGFSHDSHEKFESAHRATPVSIPLDDPARAAVALRRVGQITLAMSDSLARMDGEDWPSVRARMAALLTKLSQTIND